MSDFELSHTFIGFSFCGQNKKMECIPQHQDEMTQDLYSGLTQWFQLFPEFKFNPFYVFGESYGAKFAILIAKKISDENQRLRQSHVRMKMLSKLLLVFIYTSIGIG